MRQVIPEGIAGSRCPREQAFLFRERSAGPDRPRRRDQCAQRRVDRYLRLNALIVTFAVNAIVSADWWSSHEDDLWYEHLHTGALRLFLVSQHLRRVATATTDRQQRGRGKDRLL